MIVCHRQLSLPPPSFTPLSHAHTQQQISSSFDSNFNKLLQTVACICITVAQGKGSSKTCFCKSGQVELRMTGLMSCLQKRHVKRNEHFEKDSQDIDFKSKSV